MLKIRNLRAACCAAAALICVPAWAAEPASGTLSPASPSLAYASGPFLVSNPAGITVNGEPDCAEPALPCDDYALTVDLPAGFAAANPTAVFKVSVSWLEATDDYDIYLYDADGAIVQQSASSANPEVMTLPVAEGVNSYTVRIVPYAVTGSSTAAAITLEVPVAGGDPDKPLPPPASGLPPRYQVHVAPPLLGNDSGEPTLGFNPFTQRVMFIDYVNALRVTFPEDLDAPLPVACDATWEDKSGTITQLNTLDPIMTTDQATGRTFNSQLSGANSLFEYSDDDGETWIPGQIGIPNGGADHQGVVAGPYPEGFPVAGLSGYPNAVYYCSQSVASAFCARSDDGGQTFGPGMPFKNLDCAAGALHGHPKVAPDGTLYIPDSSQCVIGNGLDGSSDFVVAFVSEDAGMTYEVRPIPQSTGGAGSDPSIALATDGTAYMCYENGDGTTHVAVSHDKGETWINDTDIGAAAGLVATRFPAMVAGDPDRAACAFLGTTSQGPSESLDFDGVWYPYIATTYDGGLTWHLVNVAPNDPVQGVGGVGPSGVNRNLLDFNDAEIDDEGRVLFAYADGCIGTCVQDPRANSFAAKGTIVRQTGGRTLYAAFDEQMRFNNDTLLAPATACASATRSKRTATRTRFAWNAPDDGGSPVTQYDVYRATAQDGPFTQIGRTNGKTEYFDSSADPAVASYFYKVVATNALGTAPESNVVELPITEDTVVDTCTLPGEVIAIDATGDGLGDDLDFEYIAVAEPPEFEGNLVVTAKVVNFTATVPPPGSFYVMLFPLNDQRFIALDSTQGPAAFVYGTYEELPQGLLAFNNEGSLDERSAYGADGTIVMVVPKSVLGDPAPGTPIAGFDARAREGVNAASSRDVAGPGSYFVRGTAQCGLSDLVLASLDASVNEGAAPLDVDFTVAGQPSEGATMQSWSIDFGDGQSLQDQAFTGGQDNAHVTHTYRSAGTYAARVTVKDSRGNTSSNSPVEHIVVTGGAGGGTGGGGGGTADAGRFGGALGLTLLVPLAGLALRRRRARPG